MNDWRSTLEIAYIRVLKCQELDFEYEIMSGISTQDLHVDFAKYVNLGYDLETAYLGVLKYQELLIVKIRPDQILKIYKSIFQNVSVLSPDPVIQYLGVHWY